MPSALPLHLKPSEKDFPMLLAASKAPKPRFVRGAALADPHHIARPVTMEDIQSEVQRCVEDGERLRVAGGGTAANALWGTDENLLTLDHFRGVESADLERGTVWVRAGTTLGYLSNWLAARGLSLPVDGWPSGATIGGAISVGAHGSGPRTQNLSAHVSAVGLITADGVFRRLTAENAPELFGAAQLSLGALGVVSHVELRAQPAQAHRVRQFKSALEDTLARLPELRANCSQLSFEWFPGLKATRIHTAVSTDAPARNPRADTQAREWLMRNAGHWALARMGQRLPLLAGRAQQFALSALPEAERVDATPSPSVRPVLRHVKLWEAQVAVEDLPAALHKLEHLFDALKLRAYAALEVGFIAADQVWLSPAYGRETAFIRLKEFKGVDIRAQAETFHQVLDGFSARPAWGSPHGKEGAVLAALYPRWREFLVLRARLDPRGVFLNNYLAKLFDVQAP